MDEWNQADCDDFETVNPALDQIGPFPAEPPPGSPEAVVAAAETIRSLSPEPERPAHTPGLPWTVGGLYQRGSNFETIRRRAIRQGSTLVAVAHGESVAMVTERAELIASAPDLLTRVKLLELEVALLKSHRAVEQAAKEEAQRVQDELADRLEAICAQVKGLPEWLSPRKSPLQALLNEAGDALRAAGRRL